MSSEGQTSKPCFRLLPGGRQIAATCAGVRVIVAAAEDPPFAVDAVACEEDTWLALSTDTRIVRAPGHPVRVMTRVWQARPQQPGTVVVQRGTPLRLLAVVHDLDAEPTCREEWVEAALDRLLELAAERKLRSIGLPLLGTRHGDLQPQRFMPLLRRALERRARQADEVVVQRIWLMRGEQPGTELIEGLAENPA